ncbi:hypothetical protein [Anaerobacillus sp. 1_MG-2023]|uniref:hypothetical protein n=1 Tax=Anaerobacillus sp. 1_MG-2023 TaxID=3062655 RepID=UPI0026E440A6|nr:hypothetical protein [Anaerobacillus sp. 1_MG-2023]MDO6657627.1 hypothetical protein [Anaerobacillus sp. 1_MG-2023]
MSTLFSDEFCPKSKKYYDSKWARKHDSKCDKKDEDKQRKCKCDKDDHHSKWTKHDGEWKLEVHCNCKCEKEEHHSKCEEKHDKKEHDCISSLLKELAHHHHELLLPRRPQVYLQMKGTAGFVMLETGIKGPTPFTLVSYNHKTNCAKFTYESCNDVSPQVYIVDTNSLSGISIADQA